MVPVPMVPVPWLIVKSPARVVERLDMVPVVVFSVPIVPKVLLTEPPKVPPVIVAVLDVRVWIVPLVMFAAVEVVVPAVRVGIVPVVIVAAVEVVVPAVRLRMVPVVIVALVDTVRFPVAVPYVKAPVRFMFVYVPAVRASSNKLDTVVCLGASPAVRLASAIRMLSSVATAVRLG